MTITIFGTKHNIWVYIYKLCADTKKALTAKGKWKNAMITRPEKKTMVRVRFPIHTLFFFDLRKYA